MYFLGQKINYNSLRFVGIQIELLNLVVFIILFLKIFKKLKYIYNIILTIILTMLSAFISILIISNVSTNIEKSITKNYDIREIFKYMFQRSDIIDEYVFDNYAFIVFKEEGKDYIDYDIIYYLKNNDSWIIQENFENQTEFKYYMETTNNSAKLTEMYLNFINEYNVGVILINPNYEVQNGIIDSLGIEYKEIKLKNKYIYVAYINSKINNDYNLTINDKIYYPNH